MKRTNQFALIILLSLLGNNYANAQNKPLKVGDIVPDITFKNVYNGKSDHFKLSDFRGKVIILDFWGVFCVPCIEEFPKLDSIQKKFNSEIQIIPVNVLNKDSINRFFKAHHSAFLPSLPFVCADTILQKLFPHLGLPYFIWIGKDGKIIMDDLNITDQNIDAILRDKKMNFPEPVKNKYLTSLFDSKWENDISYSSYIYRAGDLGVKLGKSRQGKSISEGGTIVRLYQRAWEGLTNGKYGFFRPGRTLVVTTDPSRFIKPLKLSEYDEQIWMKNSFYWYQLNIPQNSHDNLYDIMKGDLKRSFHLKDTIAKRQVKCLVLVKTGNSDKLQTKGQRSEDSFFPVDARSMDLGNVRSLKNQPFGILSKRINALVEHSLKMPFMDETAYTGNIDIRFKGEVLDKVSLSGLRSALNEYGLDLVEKNEEMDVLVLNDCKSNN